MNNISMLAIKDIKSNKKVTLTIMISIIIVTILINSIATLTLSYQEYIVNLCRSKENWEVKFYNIKYENLKIIEGDKYIKQISIVQDLGITEKSYSEWFKNLLHIKAYDSNAIENLNISLKKGRLPKTSNEIIVNEDMNLKIGETIDAVLNGNSFSFKIVGLIENTDFDEFNYNNLTKINGAITLCNKDSIKENSIVCMYILSKDISKIYDSIHRIEEKINSDFDIEYNEELLSYACIAENGSNFQNTIIITVSILIAIISASSIAVIYTIFNISISEKKKYIASLSSIGASKKQIFKIYLIEAIIITIIAIPIGLVINYGIDNILIDVFNNLFKSIQNNLLGTSLEASAEVDLNLTYSLTTIISSVILIIIIVLLSILKPIFNISKITIIDLIRKNKYNKITKKTIRTPKFISKMFNITGELAYKNVRRSKSKYISILISLTISIVLFISINGYIYNLNSYNKLQEQDYNYSISILRNLLTDKDYTEEVFNILNQFELVDSVYGTEYLNPMFLILEKDNINDSFKFATSKVKELNKSLGKKEDKSIQLLARVMILDDKNYEEYLKQLGEDVSLKENECILVNYIDSKTKYYDGIYLTNYKKGDKIVLNILDRDEDFEQLNKISNIFNDFTNNSDNLNNSTIDIQNNQVELNIKEVTNIIPKGAHQYAYSKDVYLVVNKETFGKLFKKIFNVEFNNMLNYYIQTSNPNKLDEVVFSLNEKLKGLTQITGMNYSLIQQSNENEKLIKEILLYSFCILIAILTIINVFNIIVSNIILRKNEFAELIAIGMSKKQLNKMLSIEGLFYGTTSIIIGLIISISILYVLYKKMMDTALYAFSIPYIAVLISIISVYVIIFISIKYAKKQINKENISDIIKEK